MSSSLSQDSFPIMITGSELSVQLQQADPDTAERIRAVQQRIDVVARDIDSVLSSQAPMDHKSK